MKPTLILVADSTNARLFTTTSSHAPLQELETLSNPEGRLHERDITSDLPGKNAGSAYESQTSQHEHVMTDFARRVARQLEQMRTDRKYERLFIVAAPTFLGKLRAQLSSAVGQLVCFELAKNLTTRSNDEIRNHLPEHLAESAIAQ